MLDLEYAVTEPFLNYHLFHEGLNTKVKVLTSSLNHVIEYLLTPGNENKMNELIKKTDKSWQFPPNFSLPNPPVDESSLKSKISSKRPDKVDDNNELDYQLKKKELAQEMLYWYVSEMAIFGSFSALDDCIVDIDSWFSSWAMFNNTQDKKSESTSSNKIERLYDSHEWDMKNIKTFLPIYEYFSAVRNSIAHRQSKASHKLSEISKSQGLKESVERNFPKGKPLSEFEYNEDIFISPKTSLLCSHIIRLIFEDINKYIIKKMGIEGIIYMSCKLAFEPSSYNENKVVNLAKNRLNEIVSGRYHVIIKGEDEAVKVAESLGIWRDCAKFHANNMRKLDPKF
ncbi:hypothetical protein GKR53_14385 [Klebsiella sp. HSTU-Sny5]|uniref:hypothetical protein n=1 Tax=Klebsiella sp. HSTU-Sny5 TaxID=2663238 RepID=UPI001FB5829E|nr:hypothetical protein [Klebsiella sp. HSTU-Sny5]MCJ1875204.1 hypothetical protein [Klebsiella sp. HSTU-Sny5]HCI5985987.1 hypothetical protein [Klebsiella quasipneumoniae subsp. quasipneumoniae]